MSKSKKRSALSVSEGVDPPSQVNLDAVEQLKRSRKELPSIDDLFQGVLEGNRTLLSKAITLVESALPTHQEVAQELIKRCLPFSGKSLRIGITGVPGAGKSTFIETFGAHLIGEGRRVAVLAIDPSSERSGGSILGDKTRMESLSGNASAFIRPSPSGGTLGGVARKTRESIMLCEAAGYDLIIVETVGVGQSETAVKSMVDFFLLLMIPGAGDELQGMKRGIMEMADGIVINKADGDNISSANRSKTEFTNALHLYPLPPSGWSPKVLTCSSVEGTGISEVWKMITAFRDFTEANDYFTAQRKNQTAYWLMETLQEGLRLRFFSNPSVKEHLDKLKAMIENDEVSSFAAATELLDRYFGKFMSL
jgi:LAO/AO transport system kinase